MVSKRNLWQAPLVAFAYFYQQNARPYLELLKTTESFIDPLEGERWLDLGCGSGRLIKSIWEKSNGNVGTIIGVDISYAALRYAKQLIDTFFSEFAAKKIRLIQADFSKGVSMLLRPQTFDGITAGLSISYADHWDPDLQKWNKYSYLKLLEDVFFLLKSGGCFVFSTNVPNPNFVRIATESWREIFFTWKVPLAIAVSLIMLCQSRWLKDCARKGRFHYLPADEITSALHSVGFKEVKHELTYAEQAWVFMARK